MEDLHFIDRAKHQMFKVRRHYWDPWRNRPDPQTYIDKREIPGLKLHCQVAMNRSEA
ncbi:hypothetical protein TPB0596_42590 [Tsukamurella pulmonis]|uniref:hypothetical protein n=1 Tax=Tsukamurella pulmonis TaxID=47312 RepID=UPI001EDFB7B4|nr:hypothetical protein [Tsukamurella pulmonis]BDD84496.1 hypothetical protein TPB0596_42590 [Tsukamurella pulmonis]